MDSGGGVVVANGPEVHEFWLRLSPRPTRRPLTVATDESGGADAKRRCTPALAPLLMSGENFWAAPANDAV